MIPKIYTATLLALFPFFAFSQLPAGSIARYTLNNTINDVTGNGYDGTLSSTSGAANRFANAGSATGFTAGSSTGTLPGTLVAAMQNDYSIGFWFNTTMTAPGSTQWYGGKALFDAEVCGGTSDWGTALINGGSVAFGIGNPDITIISPGTTYNDGNRHFVTAVRDATAGSITLYIDGSPVTSTSGTATTPRAAHTLIGLGRNVCVATGVYSGSFDDAIAYSRVLSAAEVSNLYNYYSAVPLPLTWLSFSGQADAGRVLLEWKVGHVAGNDHFEVERSTDATSFYQIGLIPGKAVAGPSVQSYQYTDPSPISGHNYYRIRQVDLDGRSAYSSVIDVDMGVGSTAFRIGANPVRDVVNLLNPGQRRIERVQVLDVSGRIISDRAVGSANTMITEDVGGLQPGYYFLRVRTGAVWEVMGFVKL